MATLASGIASLIIPGLGQLFNGAWLSAIIWFLAGAVAPGIVNILSAIHAMVVAQERQPLPRRSRSRR